MNVTVEHWINGLAGHSALADALMRFSANNLVFLVPVLLIGLWFWPVAPNERALNQRIATAVVLATLLALGAGLVAGSIHYAPRPFVADSSVSLLISHGADNSFPSDHSLVVFAVAGVVILFRHLLGSVALLVAIVTAFARVFVGVHWPADVIASLLIGSAAALLAARSVDWLRSPQGWAARWLPNILVVHDMTTSDLASEVRRLVESRSFMHVEEEHNGSR